MKTGIGRAMYTPAIIQTHTRILNTSAGHLVKGTCIYFGFGPVAEKNESKLNKK